MEEYTFFEKMLLRLKSELAQWKKAQRLLINRNITSRNVERIKLVAVAKNESMYLPEWIFHHLYFGFSEIEIYYNGCSDNTEELANLLEDLPVKFINSDEVFASGIPAPQVHIYKSSFTNIESVDAVMFLDIDEFWVPIDLKRTIAQVCSLIGKFDTLSFKWFNKLEKDNLLTPALQQTISVESARQIKTLYKKYTRPQQMNPHNTLDNGLLQKFENAEYLKCINDQNSQVDCIEMPKNAYILHRKNRSQYEYVAMLLRGRPLGKLKEEHLRLKSNRAGFYFVSNPHTFSFQTVAFEDYRSYMEKHLKDERFRDYFKKAREYLDFRYSEVIKIVSDNYSTNKRDLSKLLTGITLPDITEILER